MEEEGYEPLPAKVVFIGDTTVGKTSLILRFYRGHFDDNHTASIGVSIVNKTVNIDGVRVPLHIWDTAGHEKYNSIIPMYLRGANAIVICCGSDNIQYARSLSKWLDLIREGDAENAKIVVAVTKFDMIDEGSEPPPVLAAIDWAEKNKFPIFFTSSKNGRGIEQMFGSLAKMLAESSNLRRDRTQQIQGIQDEDKKKACCS